MSRPYFYAKKIGVSRQTVVRWCEGDGRPTDSTIQRLLEAEEIEKEDFELYMDGGIDLEELLSRRKSARPSKPKVGDRLNLISIKEAIARLPTEDLLFLVQEITEEISRRWRAIRGKNSIRALVMQYRLQAIEEMGEEEVSALIQGEKPTIYDLVRLALVIPGYSSEDLIAIARKEFGELKASKEEKANGHAI
ncbi:MAG TPA: helix-turn-helix transcriptional regulator [Allocoleopsis sp.]